MGRIVNVNSKDNRRVSAFQEWNGDLPSFPNRFTHDTTTDSAKMLDQWNLRYEGTKSTRTENGKLAKASAPREKLRHGSPSFPRK